MTKKSDVPFDCSALPHKWTKGAFAQLAGLEAEIDDLAALPPPEFRFRAFHMVEPADVRVVILGMDPYPRPRQADGLAFSYPGPKPFPSALTKIFARIFNRAPLPRTGSLAGWANQGVLLLNAALTVAPNRPRSHLTKWRSFTEKSLQLIHQENSNVVFVAWGKAAIELVNKLSANSDVTNWKVLMSDHPCASTYRASSFSRFKFEKINESLDSPGIDWSKTEIVQKIDLDEQRRLT